MLKKTIMAYVHQLLDQPSQWQTSQQAGPCSVPKFTSTSITFCQTSISLNRVYWYDTMCHIFSCLDITLILMVQFSEEKTYLQIFSQSLKTLCRKFIINQTECNVSRDDILETETFHSHYFLEQPFSTKFIFFQSLKILQKNDQTIKCYIANDHIFESETF